MRVVTSTAFFLLAAVLSWTATTALGHQWRIDAGLNPDHELVMTGPYRWVRHPIYTSMLGVLLASGLMVSSWWLLLISFLVFMAGTEIRVRIEDLARLPFWGKIQGIQEEGAGLHSIHEVARKRLCGVGK